MYICVYTILEYIIYILLVCILNYIYYIYAFCMYIRVTGTAISMSYRHEDFTPLLNLSKSD